MDLLSKQIKFKEKTAARLMRDVILGLEVAHSKEILHRDIKPENILLMENKRAKIADFGWSNINEKNSMRGTYCGTEDYIAPEMIRGEPHSYPLDIWCLGVLLYEMVIGNPPFTEINQKDMRIRRELLEYNTLHTQIKFPDGFSVIPF